MDDETVSVAEVSVGRAPAVRARSQTSTPANRAARDPKRTPKPPEYIT